MKKYLIFDFDGVIADTFELNKKFSRESGHEFTEEDFLAHHDGNVYENPRIQFNPGSAEIFFGLLRDNITLMPSFFHQQELHILAKNYTLFIVSSNLEDVMLDFLNHHNIEYFSEVLGKKSHASKVVKCRNLMKKYNFTADDCYYITDTLGDIKETNELGIPSLAVTYGYHSKERMIPGNPYRFFDTPKSLLQFLI